MKDKDNKFEIDLKKAKNFFKNKLKNSKSSTTEIKEDSFRDLDDESIKISKLSARIDFLKSSLKQVKKDPPKTIKSKKIKQKKEIPDRVINSKKNKDVNGKYLKNFLMNNEIKSSESFVIASDFEINGKLFIAGNIHKLPENLIIELLNKKLIYKKDNIKDKFSDKNKTFFVKETFGLSETKRSSLRNKKNFK
ncbi:MAG: hypothetical protein CMN00_08755 [Rickettsiales bacterium]|nr:hypothetical protein [Rickettsiales bacterium]